MKKTFYSVLRTICVGAMTLFAVSCYDDSFLRNELADLGDEVDGLAARVDSLEKSLNANIKAVNKLEASMATLETSLNEALKCNAPEIEAALKAEIAALEKELSKAIADGDQALADALAAEKKAVETAMETLKTTLTSAMTESVANLDAAIKALEAAMGTKITELLSTMDAADNALDGKIADLNTALEAVKKAYADADAKISADVVAQIAEAIAKIAVTDVKVEGDKVVLTLADGSTVEVAKPSEPLTNVDNEGLVTIVEVEGVRYWAVVKDGEPESLGIPVGANVILEFEIVEGELFYTTNGEDWISTGAMVADEEHYFEEIYQGSDWDDMLLEDVLHDYYTLVFGGEEYYLPIYKVDNSSITIKAGKTYFTYGESKTIDVVVAEVTSMYVMTKPDGWRAKLNSNKLTVTAPDSAMVASNYAEAEGEILLHCTTTQGTCKIAKLAVSTTAGFSLTVNADGSFVLVNPLLNVSDYGADFNDAVIGLAAIPEFDKDPVAYVNDITSGMGHWDDVLTFVSNWKNNTMDWDTYEFTIGGMYMPGEYEVDVIESHVDSLYKFINYTTSPRGSQFVVWAAPVNSSTGEPLTDQLVFGYYAPVEVAIEANGEATFNEVPVSLRLYGAEKFYVGHIAKSQCFNYNTEEYDLKEYISSYISYLQYGVNYIGMEVEPGEHEYNLSELVNEYEEVVPLNPGEGYYAFALPIISGKALTDYSFDDLVVFEFETTALVAGGAATVEFEAEVSYTHVTVNMAADEDVSMVYYNFYTVEEYNEVEVLELDLLENGYIYLGATGSANKSVKPGEEYILAAVAVDSEGVYGTAVEFEVVVPELTYSTTFVATVGEPVFTEYTQYGQTNYKVNIPVTVTGGTAAKYYYYWNTTARTAEQLKNLPLGTAGYYYYLNSTNVPADLVFYKSSTSYQYAVVVESTDGQLSEPVIVTVNNPDAE